MTVIREYRKTDKNAVIDLIRQNTPEYFALVKFLSNVAREAFSASLI